eukprot:14123111-Alexandrium_andersonii.AAC.1
MPPPSSGLGGAGGRVPRPFAPSSCVSSSADSWAKSSARSTQLWSAGSICLGCFWAGASSLVALEDSGSWPPDVLASRGP